MTRIDTEALLERYAAGTATPEERALVERYFLHYLDNRGSLPEEKETERATGEAWQTIQAHTGAKRSRVNPIRRWSVAASILIACSVGAYLFLHKPNHPQQVAQVSQHDRLPGRNQATLTLANGQKITLTKGLSGKLAQQGSTSISVNGGNAIAYQSAAISSSVTTVQYNTLSTAKGEQSPYPLVLADGTKVWLNAQSSITFPTAFTGKERLVKVTGEAYFEVAHRSAQPFRVNAGNQVIEDIGTHFDINAYGDEPAVHTSLLEGSVKVSLDGVKNAIYLKPGQQLIKADGQSAKIKTIDPDDVIAWKNGYFQFSKEPLADIMRQVSRWYNVRVVFRDESLKGETFNGSISKYAYVSQILKKMEITGTVHFEVNGDLITVTK